MTDIDKRYLNIPETLKDDRRFALVQEGEGALHHVVAPVCALYAKPEDRADVDTQLIVGEDFVVYQEEADWAFGIAPRDHYVGWVRKSHLKEGASNATHHVVYHGTFIYSKADLKSRPVMKIPMGARLTTKGEEETRGTIYNKVENGWVVKGHLRPTDYFFSDFVSVGETTIGMTYLWAGRSPFGIDCSGLVQLCMQMAGIAVLRDSDMQEATIGEDIPLDDELSGLQRGDLIYWPGHCGMMRDEKTLLHANGHTMTVASEPLAEAVERIAYLYEKPRAVRRPALLGVGEPGQSV